LALAQRPLGKAGLGRGLWRRAAGQLAEQGAPALQRRVVAAVHLYRGEQAARALTLQPVVQLAAKTAEALVLAIAQSQQGIFEMAQVELAGEHPTHEAARAVRRL